MNLKTLFKAPSKPPLVLRCKKIQAVYAQPRNQDGHGPVVPNGWKPIEFRKPNLGEAYIPFNSHHHGPVYITNDPKVLPYEPRVILEFTGYGK